MELHSQKLQSNTQEDTNNSHYSNELLKREKIKNTPFEIIGNEEIGYFIAMGKFRLTQPEETIEQTFEKLITHQYEIITNMIIALAEEIANQKIFAQKNQEP